MYIFMNVHVRNINKKMCTNNTPSFQVDQWIQETRQLQVDQEDRFVPGDGIYSIYDTEIYKCSIIYTHV